MAKQRAETQAGTGEMREDLYSGIWPKLRNIGGPLTRCSLGEDDRDKRKRKAKPGQIRQDDHETRGGQNTVAVIGRSQVPCVKYRCICRPGVPGETTNNMRNGWCWWPLILRTRPMYGKPKVNQGA